MTLPAMDLAPLPPLRDVIAQHGLSATKALGQNFLLDERLLARIAAIPGPLDGATVYEVGPGPGGLTRALLRAGAHVLAVERDARCLPALEDLSRWSDGRLRVISGDAQHIDAAEVCGRAPFHIVANLPYNVGTALYTDWLESAEWPPAWSSLTLMFQAEVAERIIASPGSDAYGRLAVLSQWRSRARIAMRVHRSAFTPPPKVMSAVIHVEPADAPEGVRASVITRLTALGFGQRRKMLRQSLKGYPGAIDAMVAVGVDPARRAETVTISEWIAAARLLSGTRAGD